jgi:hypothetical protein
MWYRLVGSAVEHAAMMALPECKVDFQNLFLAREDQDEDSTSLAEALAVMLNQWPGSFDATDVTKLINGGNGVALREFLYPETAASEPVSPRSVGKRLTPHIGDGDRTLILRKHDDPEAGSVSC